MKRTAAAAVVLALVAPGIALADAAKPAAETSNSGEDFLAKCATETGAVKTSSGLIYREIKAGTGESPKATDVVSVNYRGTLPDGQVFSSSYDSGQPVEFSLNGVIACWAEGLQKMKAGGKSQLVCPASIAYGDKGRAPLIKPGSTLVFEVELLAIKK